MAQFLFVYRSLPFAFCFNDFARLNVWVTDRFPFETPGEPCDPLSADDSCNCRCPCAGR